MSLTNKKMVVFDLDGTLLNTKKEINESSINAIKKVINQGHCVCIATGRTLQEYVQEIIDILGLDTYIINVNGNFIYDIKTKTIHCVGAPLSQSVVDIFKDRAYELKRQLIAYNDIGEVKRYYFGTSEKNDIKDNDYFTNGVDVLSFDDLSSIDFFLRNPEHKIVHIGIKAEKEIANQLHNEMQKFEQVGLAHITLVSKVFLDADAIGVNKWKAILSIAEKLNTPLNDIYTFGDSENDYEMLFNSKHGYCMGNANVEFKKLFNPNQIIGDNDSDAIANVLIKEFNLSN